ncbi:hypothetical protein BLNAU_15223 [Blattamonas nauphoetae]|uniref:Uncharacterized protein n=1 Tax=Blattamonas nauphoetae TaxID=2049346 RepID=A0ABQ9XBG0_9EUKA|nr:hypothetical protein BLNAU_15223 [Blattamonas nauphoetae]
MGSGRRVEARQLFAPPTQDRVPPESLYYSLFLIFDSHVQHVLDQESLSRQEPATADQLACGYIGTGREQAVGFLYLPEFLIGRDNGIVASPTPLFLLNAVNPPFMSSEFHPVPPAAVPKVASIDVGTPMVLEEIADSKTDIPTTVNDTVSQLIK